MDLGGFRPTTWEAKRGRVFWKVSNVSFLNPSQKPGAYIGSPVCKSGASKRDLRKGFEGGKNHGNIIQIPEKNNGNGNLLNFNKVAGFCNGSCSTFAIHQAFPGFSASLESLLVWWSTGWCWGWGCMTWISPNPTFQQISTTRWFLLENLSCLESAMKGINLTGFHLENHQMANHHTTPGWPLLKSSIAR